MPKRPHPPPARRKKTPKAPETADEYLAVAVDLEESGERWRSGDVAKAGRFFVQAITAYENTLVRYPNNFDARYNRARLLYTLTQLPLPPTFFPATSTPETRLLAAAEAHKECNELEKDSSDILFNYGQTLSSVGEFYANKPQDSDDDNNNGNGGGDVQDEETTTREIERLQQSKQAFEASWGIFQQCLAVQEAEYKSTLEQSQSFDNFDGEDAMNDGAIVSQNGNGNGEEYQEEDGGIKLPERRSSVASSHSSNSGSGGNNTTQWASIVEPTTKLSILDTALAMLEVQTSILTLSTPSTAAAIFPPTTEYIPQITTHAASILDSYILPIARALHEETDLGLEPAEIAERRVEAVLSRANFLVALAETRFYLGLQTAEGWEEEVKAAFEPFHLISPSSTTHGTDNTTITSGDKIPENGLIIDLTTSWMALCDRSTARTTLSTTLSPTNPPKAWKLATTSSSDLASATKLAPDKEKPGIYLARGNLELLRSRIIGVEAAEKGRGVLRKNAGVYYRGVVTAAGSSLIGAVDGVKVAEAVQEARVKEAVVKLEDGMDAGLKTLVKGGIGKVAVWRTIKAAVEEGIFGRETLGAVEGVLRGI
ncbi:hypothetical protein TWF730_004936 [Orbilia blumenaviensis]|uniref:Uncharacterized protein n=1 Tax=Orbilia blumenaviensis TaxID=1796055 RepID=A0AAV9VGS3_9PEZI